jgi:hypothetical protein
MTDGAENPGEGEPSEVRPLPAPRPGHALQQGEDPRPLPKPREPHVIKKADDREADKK